MSFCLNHKKKIIFFGLVAGIYQIYIKPRLMQVIESYEKIKEFSGQTDSLRDNIQKTYSSLLPGILKKLKATLEAKYKIEELSVRVFNSSTSSEERKSMFISLKDNILSSYTPSFIAIRLTFLVSKVTLILLDKIQREFQIEPELYWSMTDESWSIISSLSSIIDNSEDLLTNIVKTKNINDDYSLVDYCLLQKAIRDKIFEVSYNTEERQIEILAFKPLLAEIKKKIAFLDSQDYNPASKDTFKIEIMLLYWQQLYDVLSSNLTSIMAIKFIEKDAEQSEKRIQSNFEDLFKQNSIEKVKMPKIVIFSVNILELVFNSEKSFFNFNNYNDQKAIDELLSYLRAITE